MNDLSRKAAKSDTTVTQYLFRGFSDSLLRLCVEMCQADWLKPKSESKT
jgi:hypothetical protein